MSGVSREEAIALGEGVTPGPWWSEGVDEDDRHLILGADHTEIAEMPVYGPHRSPANERIIRAAPRLRETVVELHDRVAELTADNDALRRETNELRVAFGRQITEQARARLTPDERLACLRAEEAGLVRIIESLPPGISRQSAEARLAEVQRQIEEETP